MSNYKENLKILYNELLHGLFLFLLGVFCVIVYIIINLIVYWYIFANIAFIIYCIAHL